MSATLERLARACILPGFAGEAAPDWLRRELDAGLGGVVLFARNVRDPEQLHALTASIRVSPETVVAIDEEGGDVTRLEAARGSSVPGALALGAVDDVELTKSVALAVAVALREAGITHDLAPVADVNTNPLNPVIGVRSFGSDPALVARHVAAFTIGLQEGGVAACAKHFPGHGATEVDSHLGLPVVEAGAEDLRAAELVPFQAAIAAGTKAVMTAHLVVPALDTLPATLSRALLTGVLRDELGFTGMVITDALEMHGVSDGWGMKESAVLALAAGADALCLGHDIDESHVARVREAIVGGVRSGRLSEERLAEAAARVAASHAARVGDTPAPTLSDIGLTAARRGVRVSGAVSGGGPVLVVELTGSASVAAGPPSHDLSGIMRELGADAERLNLVESDPAAVVAAVRAQPDRRPVIVLRDVDRHPWQRAAAAAAAAADDRTVIVDAGYPDSQPAAGARVTTFGAGRASLTAAAELLL